MKKVLKILLITTILILTMQIYFMAVIVSTDRTVETGSGTVTVTVKAKQNLGAYTLTLTDTAGLTLVSASSEGQVSSDNKTITGSSTSGITTLGSYTFNVPEVTEDTTYNVRFSITGMEDPELNTIADETNTAVVVVKAKAKEEPAPATEKPKEETPKQEAPTFTDTKKTVYATSSSTSTINLRSSWTTSSEAISIPVGTELTLTGTSTKEIDGYVWYRVSYQGTTKYVARVLLTETKPEEKKEEEEKKENEGEESSNAKLKSLVIENAELIPEFASNVTSYTVQVEESITKIEIKAVAEDSKATISIKGNEDVKEGSIITVSVSAEDGTVKIYEIKVEKIVPKANKIGLQELKIEGTDIDTKFKPEVYNYEIEVEANVKNLKIEAIPSNATATVEILGNEGLQEGENVVTVIVSSEDGKEKTTYQIKANKKGLLANDVVTEKFTIDPKMYIYIGVAAAVLLALIIVVVYTIKHRRNKRYENEFSYEEKWSATPEELMEKEKEVEDLPEREIREEREEGRHFLDTEEDIEEPKTENIRPRIDYGFEKDELKPKKGKHF